MKLLSDQLKVKRGLAGLGLFTNKIIAREEYILEYTGEVITEEEANRRGGKYLFTLNEKYVIDGKGRSNIARYINHSCKPNCYAELSHDEKQVFFRAEREIDSDEELTCDYGEVYFEDIIKPIGCRCSECSR